MASEIMFPEHPILKLRVALLIKMLYKNFLLKHLITLKSNRSAPSVCSVHYQFHKPLPIHNASCLESRVNDNKVCLPTEKDVQLLNNNHNSPWVSRSNPWNCRLFLVWGGYECICCKNEQHTHVITVMDVALSRIYMQKFDNTRHLLHRHQLPCLLDAFPSFLVVLDHSLPGHYLASPELWTWSPPRKHVLQVRLRSLPVFEFLPPASPWNDTESL